MILNPNNEDIWDALKLVLPGKRARKPKVQTEDWPCNTPANEEAL